LLKDVDASKSSRTQNISGGLVGWYTSLICTRPTWKTSSMAFNLVTYLLVSKVFRIHKRRKAINSQVVVYEVEDLGRKRDANKICDRILENHPYGCK